MFLWSWDSLPIWVAAHLLLYFWAFMLTPKPLVTFFHLFLLTQTVAFVVRPFLAYLEGGYSLYQVAELEERYVKGLALQFGANFAFVLGYVFAYFAGGGIPRFSLSISWHKLRKPLILSFLTGVSALGVAHFLSGGAWLPGARSATFTAVVPFGKLLFPLAVVPLSLVLTLSLLFVLKPPLRQVRMFSLFLTFGSLLALLLLYQRGFVITSLLIFLILAERLGWLNLRRLLAFGLISFAFLFFSRPLAVWLTTGELPALGKRLADFILFSPNFDTPDVWPVVLEYVAREGFQWGASLLAGPLAFLSPPQRLALGLPTSVDLLNAFYWGLSYWETRFGFNVTFAQELFLNFGPASLPLMVVPGLLGYALDRLAREAKKLSFSVLSGLFAVSFLGMFTGYVGSWFLWPSAYLLFGFSADLLSRIKILPRRDADPLPHHPR